LDNVVFTHNAHKWLYIRIFQNTMLKQYQ